MCLSRPGGGPGGSGGGPRGGPMGGPGGRGGSERGFYWGQPKASRGGTPREVESSLIENVPIC